MLGNRPMKKLVVPGYYRHFKQLGIGLKQLERQIFKYAYEHR